MGGACFLHFFLLLRNLIRFFFLLRTDRTHFSWAALFPFVVSPLLCVAYRNSAPVLRGISRVFEVGFVSDLSKK